MRKGIDGLTALVQTALRQKLASGSVFVFSGLLFWDGQGFCLYANDRRSYYTSFLAS
ncbi:IS66 family insertion sequence element accessory protein TnpB [Bradyrhizobium sp. BRP14]|nr:IS66 family insertion sequence element accessory protein TnpB [Bradyrhizobium sp. BRP14]